MKKRVLLLVLIATAWAIALAAHPGTISCPTDGQAMTFDHLVVGSNQFGPGPHNTCWYKHTVLWNGKRETHTAYVACDN
jgi:hypothetical protein